MRNIQVAAGHAFSLCDGMTERSAKDLKVRAADNYSSASDGVGCTAAGQYGKFVLFLF